MEAVNKQSSDKQQSAEVETKLEAYKRVCRKWLYIENDEYIDIVFGVLFANRLDAKPVWLNLIGPPGGGKTEIVQSLDGHPSIYALTSLTPHTLISGKIPEPGDKNQEDPSLMPKLNGKNLVIKDFTVLLTGRIDNVQAIFGQLRDAYDGDSSNEYGTGKNSRYHSKFGIIAAVTSVIDKHQTLLASLGERFLSYRLPKISKTEIRERTSRAMKSLSAEAQEKELKEAAWHVLAQSPPHVPIPNEDLLEDLGSFARFVAIGRTGIDRDKDRNIDRIPESEIPTRVAKQFVSLARGLAMARGLAEVTKDEVDLVCRVGLDCIPPLRLEVLRFLAGTFPETVLVKNLESHFQISYNAIRERLDDLCALGIVEKVRTVKDAPIDNKPNLKTTQIEFRLVKEWGTVLPPIINRSKPVETTS